MALKSEKTRVWVTVLKDSGSVNSKNTFIHEMFPEFLQPFGYFGKRRGYPFWLVTLIFSGFWICGWVWTSIVPFLLICLSLDAGAGIERALSCGNDVGVANELDEERAVDRPGTTIHTQSSASRWIRTHSYTCFLAIGPLLWISVNLEELSEREHCSRIFDDFYSQESIQFSDVKMSPLHASALFHWLLWLS